MNPDKIKLVIFDLDGVLLDSCEWHRVALNNSLLKTINYEISLEDHYRKFNGIPTKAKISLLKTDFGISITKENEEQIYALKQQETFKIIREKCIEDPKKTEMIHWLSQKYKIACFTNTIRETANLMLSSMKIEHYFNKITSNQDIKNAKPAPDGYILTMEALNALPSETLILEDSEVGLQAAYASQANVCKVSSTEEVTMELFQRLGL